MGGYRVDFRLTPPSEAALRDSKRTTSVRVGRVPVPASESCHNVLMRMWRHATVLPGYVWTPMQPGARPRSASVL